MCPAHKHVSKAPTATESFKGIGDINFFFFVNRIIQKALFSSRVLVPLKSCNQALSELYDALYHYATA
jgi:hypothetical protein